MQLAETFQLCTFVMRRTVCPVTTTTDPEIYYFCSVGEDSHDYGIMLERLTDSFNQEYELEEVCGFI